MSLIVIKRTATSINVDEELWKKAKMEAIKRGITVTELFEKALKKEIEKNQ
jgi:post-segregation antitoxin (ccd killing protein)